MSRPDAQVEDLDATECRRLLRSENLGRLSIVAAGRPDVFPLNYLVFDDDIYFRTSPGTKLDALGEGTEVAFEIDGRRRRRVWSVVVHGTARPVTDAELAQSSRVTRLPTDLPGEKDHYVQVEASEVTGRAFSGARRPWSPGRLVLTGVVVAVVIAAIGILAQAMHLG
jgi:nitroimidazol reductase NimA-like FMN-containing flavoprotein (pyridoxamine 5'-phosphate oxidase superfamily)